MTMVVAPSFQRHHQIDHASVLGRLYQLPRAVQVPYHRGLQAKYHRAREGGDDGRRHQVRTSK